MADHVGDPDCGLGVSGEVVANACGRIIFNEAEAYIARKNAATLADKAFLESPPTKFNTEWLRFICIYAKVGSPDLAHLAWIGDWWVRRERPPDRGYSCSMWYEHLDGFIERAARGLFDLIDPEGDFMKEVLQHQNCGTQGRFPPSTKLLMDTFPLYVKNFGGLELFYNGKYQDHVCKMCPLVTVSGYFCMPTLGGYDKQDIFVGTASDGCIQTYTKVERTAETLGCHILADGGFTRTPRVRIPFNKTDIWGKTTKQQAAERLTYNGVFAYWRARAEHMFGAGRSSPLFEACTPTACST